MKKAIVLLADGFEDVEAITPVDYLRRAGIEVVTASISERLTVTSRWGGIKLIADTTLTEIKDQTANNKEPDKISKQIEWDAVVIPGGMPGAPNIAASKNVNLLIKGMAAAGKLVCAICASPVVVLAPLGLLAGKRFTCYPGLEKKTTDGEWSDARVVVDCNIITSRGAGTAGEFAIAIIGKMLDEATAKKISEAVLL
jgi:4-methyl-5(b-hydroxyethyl)-thiazole monophosphate biosynthesis